MGTETKINCYTQNTVNGATAATTVNLAFVKGSSATGSRVTCSSSAAFNLNGYDSDNKKAAAALNEAFKQQQQEQQQQESAAEAVVPYVRVYIDEHNVIEGAKEILKVIRPHWDLNAVQFKKFTDGITNKLVGCFYEPAQASNKVTTLTNGHSKETANLTNNISPTKSENDEAVQAKTKFSNVVLVRVYGNKTDLLIDRKAETRNIMLLYKYGLAPSLYATFKNGLAYDYVPGVTLNATNVLYPEVWSLVARRLAELHRIEGPRHEQKRVPMLWKKIQSFFDLVPERFSNADAHNRLKETFLPITRMRTEFAELYSHLEALNSPLVFAHNDLLLGNVIYTESQRSVTFIDYEYADYNFQAFDIGNHFAEFAGVDEVDYSRYPKREFQMQWLSVYLSAFKDDPNVQPDELERLYVQVNQFALAAHFFWTIWSLLQAEYSTNEFDYADYALIRYNEYLKRKQEFLCLKNETSS